MLYNWQTKCDCSNVCLLRFVHYTHIFVILLENIGKMLVSSDRTHSVQSCTAGIGSNVEWSFVCADHVNLHGCCCWSTSVAPSTPGTCQTDRPKWASHSRGGGGVWMLLPSDCNQWLLSFALPVIAICDWIGMACICRHSCVEQLFAPPRFQQHHLLFQ